jgi:hypothetical protein
MPFSTACSTSLSNFEANLNYKDVDDPAIMVSFPVVGDADGAALVAWTTTPWTLPSNVALCVNAAFTYVKVGACSLSLYSQDPRRDGVWDGRAGFMGGQRRGGAGEQGSTNVQGACHMQNARLLAVVKVHDVNKRLCFPSEHCACIIMPRPQVRDPVKNKVYIVAESRLPFLPGAVPKAGKKKEDKPQVLQGLAGGSLGFERAAAAAGRVLGGGDQEDMEGMGSSIVRARNR